MIDRVPCDHGRDVRGVHYRGRRLDGADPASARVEHFSQYAVEGAAVFREVERITGADPDSFVGLSRNYGRDARRAYWRARPIAEADVAAFVAVGDLYAKDGRRVYHAGEPLEGADPASFVDRRRRATPHDAEDRSSTWRRGERLADR